MDHQDEPEDAGAAAEGILEAVEQGIEAGLDLEASPAPEGSCNNEMAESEAVPPRGAAAAAAVVVAPLPEVVIAESDSPPSEDQPENLAQVGIFSSSTISIIRVTLNTDFDS